MRHEMSNFVTTVQDYVTNQVLDVTWGEFESEVADGRRVASVDSLHEAHSRYLRKALFRSGEEHSRTPSCTCMLIKFTSPGAS